MSYPGFFSGGGFDAEASKAESGDGVRREGAASPSPIARESGERCKGSGVKLKSKRWSPEGCRQSLDLTRGGDSNLTNTLGTPVLSPVVSHTATRL